ncbi:hypothetical protein [Deinococcus irradiatisoli]|nr:hypothetical protein [Deinococcus irradiatisoli]
MNFTLSTRRFLSACLLGGVLLSSFSEARPTGGQVVAHLKLVCTPNCLPA